MVAEDPPRRRLCVRPPRKHGAFAYFYDDEQLDCFFRVTEAPRYRTADQPTKVPSLGQFGALVAAVPPNVPRPKCTQCATDHAPPTHHPLEQRPSLLLLRSSGCIAKEEAAITSTSTSLLSIH